MKVCFFWILMLSISSRGLAVTQAFGDKIVLKDVTPLTAAIKDFAGLKDRDLLTSGRVVKVCAKKGCWMTVKTDADDVRVTFKDYRFFVPLNAAGQVARLQGRLERKEVSVADQRHLLEDAGASDAELKAVTAPKWEFSFVAAGVELSPGG